MSISAWADVSRKAEYQQNPEDQEAIDTLESLLLGNTLAPEAASVINAIYEPSIKASRTDAVDVFWAILSDAARVNGSTTKQADRLADLIIALQTLQEITDEMGVPLESKHGGLYWKDLPGWQVSFREYGIGIDGPGDFTGDWTWRDQIQPLLSATTFAATLLMRAPFDSGMQFHAYTALECALRSTSDNLENHQYAELYLPAAATWILVAGQKIREACINSRISVHVLQPHPELWNKWRKRYLEIAANSEFSSSSREWATRAAACMQVI